MVRVLSALLLGAQLFFSAVAAQAAFAVARPVARDLVGYMLPRLDGATIVICASLVFLLRDGRLALAPLFAGLCALASIAWLTPLIHSMTPGMPRFGMMHGISSSLLLVEMILLAITAFFG